MLFIEEYLIHKENLSLLTGIVNLIICIYLYLNNFKVIFYIWLILSILTEIKQEYDIEKLRRTVYVN